jgi:hypothetical protein
MPLTAQLPVCACVFLIRCTWRGRWHARALIMVANRCRLLTNGRRHAQHSTSPPTGRSLYASFRLFLCLPFLSLSTFCLLPLDHVPHAPCLSVAGLLQSPGSKAATTTGRRTTCTPSPTQSRPTPSALAESHPPQPSRHLAVRRRPPSAHLVVGGGAALLVTRWGMYFPRSFCSAADAARRQAPARGMLPPWLTLARGPQMGRPGSAASLGCGAGRCPAVAAAGARRPGLHRVAACWGERGSSRDPRPCCSCCR